MHCTPQIFFRQSLPARPRLNCTLDAPITLASIAAAHLPKPHVTLFSMAISHIGTPRPQRGQGQHLELWGNILSDVSQPAPTLRFFYVLRIIKMFVKNWQQNCGASSSSKSVNTMIYVSLNSVKTFCFQLQGS